MKRTLSTLVMLLSLSTPFALFANEMEDGVEGAKEMLMDESTTISTDAPKATPDAAIEGEGPAVAAPEATPEAVPVAAPEAAPEVASEGTPEVKPEEAVSEEPALEDEHDSAEHEMGPDSEH